MLFEPKKRTRLGHYCQKVPRAISPGFSEHPIGSGLTALISTNSRLSGQVAAVAFGHELVRSRGHGRRSVQPLRSECYRRDGVNFRAFADSKGQWSFGERQDSHGAGGCRAVTEKGKSFVLSKIPDPDGIMATHNSYSFWEIRCVSINSDIFAK